MAGHAPGRRGAPAQGPILRGAGIGAGVLHHRQPPGWFVPSDSAVCAAPLASACRRGPGRASRGAHIPGPAAIETLLGTSRPSTMGPKLGRACKKQTETTGTLAAMPSPWATAPPQEEGRRIPRPGTDVQSVRIWTCCLCDSASSESSDVPRSPGFKEKGKDFQCQEPAPRRDHRRRVLRPPPLTAPPSSGAYPAQFVPVRG